MSRSPTSTLSLIAYAGPAIPLAMLGMPLLLYIPPFYTQELGLELGAAGMIFLLARAWDAVTDPLIGNFSDRTRGRFGRRKPWLIVGAPLLMIGVYAFLSPPTEIGGVYLGVTALGFYIAWTILQIPYLSWGAELSRDYAQRTRITGIRETGTMVGIVLATVLPILFLDSPDPSLREILWVYVVALLILIPVTIGLATLITPTSQRIETQDHSLLVALRLLPRNKIFMRLLGAVFLIWLGGSIFNSCLLFMVEHLLELTRADFLKLVLVQYVLAILFVPVWVKVANRVGRHWVLILGSAGFLGAQLLFFLVTPGVFWQALLVYCITGPIASIIWVMPPALVADTIEYGMMKGGGDEAALYMALYNFVMKAAFAVGVGIAMGLLGVVGFEPGAANATEVLSKFAFVALVLPAIIGVVGAALLINYPLTARRHHAIRRWLARRGLQELG